MMRIIYMDSHIAVAFKPAGILSQPSGRFEADMVSEIKKYIAKTTGERNAYVGCVHRLDQPVKGVMVYGLTKKDSANLSAQMASFGHMDKEYLALVCAGFEQKKFTLRDDLCFDRKTNTSVAAKKSGCKNHAPQAVKEAVLNAEVLAEYSYEKLIEAAHGGNETVCEAFGKETDILNERNRILPDGVYSFVKIKLHTGRHHQIRAQFANAGASVLGDVRYNPCMTGYRGESALCLMAASISFEHPATGKRVTFSAF